MAGSRLLRPQYIEASQPLILGVTVAYFFDDLPCGAGGGCTADDPSIDS